MKRNGAWLLVALFGLGCEQDGMTLRAEGELLGVKGFDMLEGRVKLEEAPPGVRIVVWLENAPPGPKAVHVHEKGDCKNPLVESSEPHGLPSAPNHHPGDLGNLIIREDGSGALELTTTSGNLKPNDPMSFANRAIVVHQAGERGTRPSGDAGKPLACAVIRSG